ncbi:MAG: NTP transferase domain-containing protein [Nitrososphaerota archaeon]|nr:NTP transferase domain-containing protein [Nitrososphaerota archaeon]
MSKVACAILAAGMSVRFDGIKQLVELRGKPLVQYAIDAANASTANYVFLIVGAHSDQILAKVNLGRAQPLLNKDFRRGLSTSIRCAISNIPPDSDAVMFMVADQPFVEPFHLNLLISEYRKTRAPIVALSEGNEPRNPVLIGSQLYPELQKLVGDVGARQIVGRYLDRVRLVRIEDKRAFLDIDTKAEMVKLETQMRNLTYSEGSKDNSSVVISHRKDADGLTSAALIRYMTKCKVYLTDYADMVETMSKVGQASEVFICDLGLNPNTFPGFLDQINRLAKHGKVHYIDHHPIKPDYSVKLSQAGVDLYHSTEECAAVLVYKKYHEKLNVPKMKIVACCGAITDYLDSQPAAKKLISSFDRQFLLYESTVLSFAIASIGRQSKDDDAPLLRIVHDLASGKLPHEIDDSARLAQEHAAQSEKLMDLVVKNGSKRKHYAYYLTKESATGNVANFLVGAFDVPVGVSFRAEEDGFYEISLRSTEESKHDLGKIIGRIAAKLNASGGGHPHASGARIRQAQLDEFLSSLDEELSLPAQ